MKENVKEFKRNVCFVFFESYLEQGKKLKKLWGAEKAYEYFVALIEYGLYKKETDDPEIDMIVSGLKNTIDANQEKRAKGFEREDTEQTKTILEYKNKHPEASQREIANATNCSVGKVNKVLSNNNVNINTNANSNSVNMNVNEYGADKNVKKKNRWLDDLTDEELESILSDYKKRVPYTEIKQRLSLRYNVTKDTPEDVKGVLEMRKTKAKCKRFEESIAKAEDSKIEEIASLFSCDKHMILDKLLRVDLDVDEVLEWCTIYEDCESMHQIYERNRDLYQTYDEFVEMMFRTNTLKDG